MNANQQKIDAFGEQLRAKINSKFQITAFLAGFAFSVLSVQASVLWGGNVISYFLLATSVLFSIAAIILYIFCLVELDVLTMPKRFWEVKPDPKRQLPPQFDSWLLEDSDLFLLKDLMVCYWVRLALVAVTLMSLSILCMLIPFLIDYSPDAAGGKKFFLPGFLITILLCYIYKLWVNKKAASIGALRKLQD